MKRMIWVVAVLCWAFVSDPAGPYSPWVYGAEAREPVLQVKKPGHSLPVKGIYGVPSIKQGDPFAYSREMEKDGVNAIGTGVEAQVEALSAGRVREVFVREDYVVRNGKIRFKLEAYGVKVFLGKKDSP